MLLSATARAWRLVFALMLVLAACAPRASEPVPDPAAQPAAPAEPADAVPPGPDAAAVARGTTAFGIDLYRRLAREERNLFFSPLSISGAFGMVHAGARGETEAEIARVLHYSLPQARLHPALGALLRGLPLDQPGRKLTVANALWVQQGYGLLPDYVRLLGDHYGAAPQTADFVGAAPEAAARINRWAEQNTNGRIRNLLRAGDLTPMTRMVLTNAVWMKADWLRQFDRQATRPRPFFAAGGGSAAIPFMHQEGRFRHLDRPGFQAIELPYRGEELAMIVLLPKTRDGLGALERELDAGRLEQWIDELRRSEPQLVDLAFPKIELETRYQLARTLQDMGIRLAFGAQADFSGIGGRRDLVIDKAIHQTFLLVDETGTEAAAVTAIIMAESSAPRSIRFHAEHPFLFLIRDNRSGTLLFMGRLVEPPSPPS